MRNCPEGLPNHKSATPVGPQCTMNSIGRHYRDQADTSIPTCDYELNGTKCSFFSSSENDDLVQLPYPGDITLGPVSEVPPPATQSGDLSTILQLLQQQKADSEKTNEQMRQLQGQVNSLLLTNNTPNTSSQSNPAPTRNSPLTGNSAPAPPPIFTTPTTTAPHVVASAAAGLSAALQAGLGHSHNYGYTGLTMDQLRSDPVIASQAAAILSTATQNVPPLNPNPLSGMGAALGNLRNDQVISSVDQLYNATTVNKQLRAYEFASTGQFPYKNQLKQDNCNAVTFAYGALKHLEAVKSGLIKNMSETEFLSRLRHLKNVFEIACLSSSLSSFSDPSWQVAREYDARVIADIESGVKTWDKLSQGLETDSIYCAKETVELKNKGKKPVKEPKDSKNAGKVEDEKSRKLDPRKNGCTTFNTHRASEGCYWEHVNKGTCIFEHFCSWCKANRDIKEKHKSLNCEFKPE